jgi:hypothetical protein
MALLEVDQLQTHFRTPDGINRAVDGVSFGIAAGDWASRNAEMNALVTRIEASESAMQQTQDELAAIFAEYEEPPALTTAEKAEFADKLRDIVGLYVDPPAHAAWPAARPPRTAQQVPKLNVITASISRYEVAACSAYAAVSYRRVGTPFPLFPGGGVPEAGVSSCPPSSRGAAKAPAVPVEGVGAGPQQHGSAAGTGAGRAGEEEAEAGKGAIKGEEAEWEVLPGEEDEEEEEEEDGAATPRLVSMAARARASFSIAAFWAFSSASTLSCCCRLRFHEALIRRWS